MPPDRRFALFGAVLGLTAVGLGAFGAHALQNVVAADLLETFETGVRYQMYHAVALFVVSLLATRWQAPQLAWGGWLFLAGTVIFSGTLYALTLTGAGWWGAVTPLGGVLLLMGWASLIWGILGSEQRATPG